jgi:hypothetical protein
MEQRKTARNGNHVAARATLRRASLLLLAASMLAGTPVRAWGPNGHRLVANKAVETLPMELRPWFEAGRTFLSLHVTDPFDWRAKNPASERHNQIIHLEKYGRFPFDSLPRDYKAALKKFPKATLEANGLLPWQIGLYSERLTNSFRAGKWDEARLNAAILAFYVAESHDPFSTTENFDGRLSGQIGVDSRFDLNMVDRFALFIYVRPGDAQLISDPTDHAFEACLTSHGWIEPVLLADRRARHGLHDYTDEFYARFYNTAGAILIRQLTDAATDVGSYWLTAWNNAGRPQPPSN